MTLSPSDNALPIARSGSTRPLDHPLSDRPGRLEEESATAGLIPAGLMLAAGLAALVIGSLFADRVEGQFIVISAPATRAVQVVIHADGALVAGGGFGNIMIAASDAPDFVERLHASGAWLVLRAPRFLGCAARADTGMM